MLTQLSMLCNWLAPLLPALLHLRGHQNYGAPTDCPISVPSKNGWTFVMGMAGPVELEVCPRLSFAGFWASVTASAAGAGSGAGPLNMFPPAGRVSTAGRSSSVTDSSSIRALPGRTTCAAGSCQGETSGIYGYTLSSGVTILKPKRRRARSCVTVLEDRTFHNPLPVKFYITLLMLQNSFFIS